MASWQPRRPFYRSPIARDEAKPVKDCLEPFINVAFLATVVVRQPTALVWSQAADIKDIFSYLLRLVGGLQRLCASAVVAVIALDHRVIFSHLLHWHFVNAPGKKGFMVAPESGSVIFQLTTDKLRGLTETQILPVVIFIVQPWTPVLPSPLFRACFSEGKSKWIFLWPNKSVWEQDKRANGLFLEFSLLMVWPVATEDVH